MPIKLLKWPPTVTGMFAADAKRTLELEMAPTAPSLDECKEMVKQAYGNMSSLKIYFHNSFEVMSIVREEDFSFCMKKFKINYANYIHHVDTNRLYIIANPTVKGNEPETQPPKLCPTSTVIIKLISTSLKGLRRSFLLLKSYQAINSSVLVATLVHYMAKDE